MSALLLSLVLCNVDRIYVLHYQPNIERRTALEQSLREQKLEATWITKYDREELDAETIAASYSQFRHVQDSWDGDVYVTHGLSPAHISIALKHIEAYRQIVSDNIATALIFEDDVQLRPNFKTQLLKYIQDLPSDWDMLCIGEGNPVTHVSTKDQHAGQHVYRRRWVRRS